MSRISSQDFFFAKVPSNRFYLLAVATKLRKVDFTNFFKLALISSFFSAATQILRENDFGKFLVLKVTNWTITVYSILGKFEISQNRFHVKSKWFSMKSSRISTLCHVDFLKPNGIALYAKFKFFYHKS